MAETTTPTTEDVFAETPDEELLRHARVAVGHLRKAYDILFVSQTSATATTYGREALEDAVRLLDYLHSDWGAWAQKEATQARPKGTMP